MASHIAGEYEIPVPLNTAYEDTSLYIEPNRFVEIESVECGSQNQNLSTDKLEIEVNPSYMPNLKKLVSIHDDKCKNESVITSPNPCYGFGAVRPSRQPTLTDTAISSQDTEIINHPTISSKDINTQEYLMIIDEPTNTQEYLMIIDEPTADNIEPQLQPNPSYCVTRSSKYEEGGDLNLLNEGTESTIHQAKNTEENNNQICQQENDNITIEQNSSYVPVSIPPRRRQARSRQKKAEYVIIVFSILSIILSSLSIFTTIGLWTQKFENVKIEMSTIDSSIERSQCNCSMQVITPIVSLTSLMELEKNLSYLSLELNNQNLKISRLNDILSLIKSVNDSVQQINEKCSLLRSISGNNDSFSETCPPNITAVNQPASVNINITDECTTIRKTPCSVPAVPSQLTALFCPTATINIVIDDTILVDFTCHLAFTDDSEDPVNGVGIIRTDSLRDVPPGAVFENLLSDTARISCQCVSFEPKEVNCVTYETRCHYKRGPIDTHINT